jgi:hypothetical protein
VAGSSTSDAVVVLVSTLLLGSCSSPDVRFEDLGIPSTARAVQASAVYRDLLLATVFETKGDNRLVVVHLGGVGQEEIPLPGAKGADALAVDELRGEAFVGTSLEPGLWRFDIEARHMARVESMDRFLVGERYVWSLALDGQGRVFLGTYPGGKLLLHDPVTGRSYDLGTPVPGRQYLRHLLVGPSGTVYCGLGTPAAVASVDPRTGRVRILHESPIGGASFASFGRIEAGRLTVGLEGGGERRLKVDEPAAASPTELPAVVEIDPDGRYRVSRGGSTATGAIDLAARQDGMSIMGLATGPDGRIYGATYYNASLFRVEPDSGQVVPLGRVGGAPGEFRVMAPIDDHRLLLPGYTGLLYRYDLDRPWSSGGLDANPSLIGEIGHGQHLATGVDRDASGLVAIATPPNYGKRGGAITLFDPASGAWRTLTGLVPDQAIRCLRFAGDGRLYAGSSIDVGRGETVVARSAHLIAVDPTSGGILLDVVPVPDARAITAVVSLDGRRVLGATDTGRLFVHDLESHATRLIEGLPNIRDLAWWETEGVVLGIGWRRGLFRLDPGTLAISWIEGSPEKLGPGIAFDRLGRVYLHDGTRVYRMTADR